MQFAEYNCKALLYWHVKCENRAASMVFLFGVPIIFKVMVVAFTTWLGWLIPAEVHIFSRSWIKVDG